MGEPILIAGTGWKMNQKLPNWWKNLPFFGGRNRHIIIWQYRRHSGRENSLIGYGK
jgi:hypothetical protein